MSKSLLKEIANATKGETTVVDPDASGLAGLALTTATIYESREFDLTGLEAFRIGVKFGGSFTPTQGKVDIRFQGLDADGGTVPDGNNGVYLIVGDWEPRHTTNNSLLFDKWGNLFSEITPGVSYPFNGQENARAIFSYPRCKLQFRVQTVFDDTPPTIDVWTHLIR